MKDKSVQELINLFHSKKFTILEKKIIELIKKNTKNFIIYNLFGAVLINKKNLNNQNIFIFGIKPTNPSEEYGYFLTKKIRKNINKVTKFIEKPKQSKAKQVIKKNGYWNSGMFFLRKDSIIYNFRKYQQKTFKSCLEAINKAKIKQN